MDYDRSVQDLPRSMSLLCYIVGVIIKSINIIIVMHRYQITLLRPLSVFAPPSAPTAFLPLAYPLGNITHSPTFPS